MTKTAKDIIKDLKKSGSFLMPPGDLTEIRELSCDLQFKFCEIPEDYISLLKEADGIQGPGFTLYGTKTQTLGGGQLVADLFVATIQAANKEIYSDGIMLGDAVGNTYIVYSKEANEYQILDKVTSDVIYRYKYIGDFIKARIEIQNSILNKYKE